MTSIKKTISLVFTKCQKIALKFQTVDGNLEFAEGIFYVTWSCSWL